MNTFDYDIIPQQNLNDLFDFCNERYFNSEITVPVKTRWSNAFTTKLGHAGRHKSKKSYEIALSDELQNSAKHLLSVMVHEMIHIWQYQMYATTHNLKYLDRPKDNKKSFGHRKGHGFFFHEYMNKLNTLFPELDITVYADEEKMAEIRDNPTIHAILIEYVTFKKLTRQNIYQSKESFGDDLSSLMNDLKTVYGESNIKKIQLLSTNNKLAYGLTSLTKSGGLRKGSKPCYIENRDVSIILNDESTVMGQVIDLKQTKNENSCTEELAAFLPFVRPSKYRKLNEYALTIFTHVKPFNENWLPGDALAGLNQEIKKEDIELIINSWRDASKRELLNNDIVKSATSRIQANILRGTPAEVSLNILKGTWNSLGEDRVTFQDLRNKVENSIKKELSRYDFNNKIEEHFSHIPLNTDKSTLFTVIGMNTEHLHLQYEKFRSIVIGNCIQNNIAIDSIALDKIHKYWKSFPSFAYALNIHGDQIKRQLKTLIAHPEFAIEDRKEEIYAIADEINNLHERVGKENFIYEIIRATGIEKLDMLKGGSVSMQDKLDVYNRINDISIILTGRKFNKTKNYCVELEPGT